MIIVITIILQDDGTLVYADIGRHPAPMKSNTLLLDDNRVTYALLDHTVHNKASTSQESSADKTGGKCKLLYLYL